MSDADKNLRIEITTTADLAGVKQTNAAVTDLGKQDVAANVAVQQATAKTISVKQQLQQGIKGLSAAFPQLAAAARFALNPITLSITGLSLAASVLKDKLSGVGEVLTSSQWESSRISKAAVAMQEYAKAVKAVTDSTGQLKSDLNEISSKFGLLEKLGGKGNPLVERRKAEAEAYAQSKAAFTNRTKAAALRQQAGQIKAGGSDANDEDILGGLEAGVGDAPERLAAIDAEIAAIEGLDEKTDFRSAVMGMPGKFGTTMKMLAQYGFTDPKQVIGALNDQRAGYAGIIGRRDKFKAAIPGRSAARSAKSNLLTRASELDGQAGEQESAARSTALGAQVNFGVAQMQAGNPVPVTPTGAGMAVSPEASAQIQKAYADLMAMVNMFVEGNARLRATVEQAQNQQKNAR